MTGGDFLKIRDRVIVITGASSGIGRATAIRASLQGVRVALVSRRPDSLTETAAMLRGTGHLTLPFDVTDYESIPALFQRIREEMGPVSGVLHAAGQHAITPLRLANAKQSAEMFNINVTSGLMIAKALRNPRIRADQSSLVLMSSAIGLVGEAGVSIYSATKGAVASLGKSLALELARDGVRVNSIAAGIVQTALTDGLREKVGQAAWAGIEEAHPLGLGTAEDVADAALYLLSPVSQWVTGTTLVIDGGYTAR